VLAWVVPVDFTSALVMLLTLPLVPVFMVLIGRHTERRTRARARALALLGTHFLDVVRGLPTLRAFNRGGAQVTSIAEASEQYRRTTMRTLRVAFLSGAVLELAATLGIALVAVTVGVRLVDGAIGLEAGLTVLLLAPELYLPLRMLGAQYHASADGLAVAGRLLELTDGPAVADAREAPAAPPDGAAVLLEDVSYAYPARAGAVLDGVDLELRPGETVALVGPSGSGKSTLASLVLGLAEPTTGRVRVNGQGVAWVPQRATLFTGTVADNIRLGDPAAGSERVTAAAQLADADAFIRSLPDGYETVVGDGGRTLSAGERQRIAVARAFLRDAPLVVLDEPTANLDPASAEAVADALDRLSDGRTVLLIAHRPELARRAIERGGWSRVTSTSKSTARSAVPPLAAPVWDSLALLLTLVIRPTKAVSGKASIDTATESPRWSRTTSVSSTWTLASTTDRSATVMSRPVSREKVPGTATSPSSTARRTTRPLIGETSFVLARLLRASARAARACSTPAWADRKLASATSKAWKATRTT